MGAVDGDKGSEMRLEDFKDRSGNWVKSIKPPNSAQIYTRAGRYWDGLVNRCNPKSVQNSRVGAYIGCTNGFLDFQHFCEWIQTQTGYGNDSWELDKDIISSADKSYSPEHCCLVPHELNAFFIQRKFKGKNLPTGVTFHKASGKYAPGIWVDGKRKHIGVYATPAEAHIAYKLAKKTRAKELARKWEGIVDGRVIAALLNYEVPPSNNKE